MTPLCPPLYVRHFSPWFCASSANAQTKFSDTGRRTARLPLLMRRVTYFVGEPGVLGPEFCNSTLRERSRR